jgi:ABC-type transporter Mla subunit MlaD
MPDAISQLETVVVTLDRQGKTAVDALQGARNRLGSIYVTVAELSRDSKDRRTPPLLSAFDAELERTEGFVRSLQTSLHGTSGALLLLESIPFLGPRLSAPTAQDSNLKNLASNLTAMSNVLEQVARILAEIRAERSVDSSQVAVLKNALDRVDVQLEQIQSEIQGFSAEMGTVAVKLSEAKRGSPHWIKQAAVFGVLLFICFGFSQISLLQQGLRLFRGASRSAC